MATMTMTDGLGLHYETLGEGPPLMLVHGAWSDVSTWRLVSHLFAERFTVVMYDRRAHGESGPRDAPHTVRHHVDDLAVLVDGLALGPVHVAGFSFGALLTMAFAAEHPALVRRAVGHDPAVLGALASRPDHAAVHARMLADLAMVRDILAVGDHARGAQVFCDAVAFGPGAWDSLPLDEQARFTAHGPAYLGEVNDPELVETDASAFAEVDAPLLLTFGAQSPPMFAAIGEVLESVLPGATVRRFDEWGHVPHISHPDEYVEVVGDFLAR